jgi:hypothetical protein
LNWVTTHEHLKLDLSAWQKYFGFDKTGSLVNMRIHVDLEDLKMTWTTAGKIPELATGASFRYDFAGAVAGARRAPGPFVKTPHDQETISIDPRIAGPLPN